MTENKDKNILIINHKVELLIWLIVILLLSLMFFVGRINSNDKENEYNIFMPDVDGLIVGSPVRAMGIEVGYVTKIQPVKDEVFIKFLITDETVKIPQGTRATVEFSGMAGSKSLQLYLPDKNTYLDSSVPLLTSDSPKRLNDAAGLLNEMFKKIGNIIAVSSRFGSKLRELDFPEKSRKADNAKEFLQYVDGIIDTQQERVDNLGRILNERRK